MTGTNRSAGSRMSQCGFSLDRFATSMRADFRFAPLNVLLLVAIVLFVVNIFVPDALPFVDEILGKKAKDSLEDVAEPVIQRSVPTPLPEILDDDEIAMRLDRALDFRVGGIAGRLGLCRLPMRRGGAFYQRLAAYGQMGRLDLDLPWEAVDAAEALQSG